jgi:F-type H+-transporting ATPase subunit gamma
VAKARKILKRAKAVGSIRTVTKTMEMVSTARFRRTHSYVSHSRPYTDKLTALVAEVIDRCEGQAVHPLLTEPDAGLKREVLMVLTSDRGLCGGYNGSVVRTALERLGQTRQAGYDVRLHVAGRKGVNTLKFRGVSVDREYTDWPQVPDYRQVGALAERFMEQYVHGKLAGLEVAYTRLMSGTSYRPVIAQILPLSEVSSPRPAPAQTGLEMPYELHPSAEEILRNLLPAAVRLRLYQCFLDAAVCEQIARMSAMRSATENADELIGSLTVQYNRMRQAQITTELSEIMGGRASLE